MVVFTTISCISPRNQFMFCDFSHFSMASRLSPLRSWILPTSFYILPSAWVTSSSVTWPHLRLISPTSCLNFPFN